MNAGNQWEQNGYIWDPTVGQWVEKPGFGAGGEQNQYMDYNSYWGGQNGDPSQGHNVPAEGHGEIGYSNAGVGMNSGAEIYHGQNSDVNQHNMLGSSVDPENSAQTGELDSSVTTEESGNRSLGNVEGGATDASYTNEEDEDDDEEEEEEDDDESGIDEEEVSDRNTNSHSHAGASYETETEGSVLRGSKGFTYGGHIQSRGELGVGGVSDVSNQMEALTLQGSDNVPQNVAEHVKGVHMYSNQSHYDADAQLQQHHQQQGVPLYQNNQQPKLVTQPPQNGQNTGILPPPPGPQSMSWPPVAASEPPSDTTEATETSDNQPQDESTTTPTFSDWEMVQKTDSDVLHNPVPPPHSQTIPPPNVHSRNASMDNNVKFFISSNNSSARVSPANSGKTGDEHEENDHAVSHTQTSNIAKPTEGNVAKVEAAQIFGPPPPMPGSGFQGGNPFRKGKQDPPRVTSSEDVSLLSSTQLDVTRPNYENSPVVLSQSISPIMGNMQQGKVQADSESPEFEASKPQTGNLPDTPVSTHGKKNVNTVKQSPIMPRKESAFQPLKSSQETRNKPVRASHDIPGVNQHETVGKSGSKHSNTDKRGRQTPELDKSKGRRTPDRDSRDKAAKRAIDNRQGCRTPDWDADDRRVSHKSPDREREKRAEKDSNADKLSSRPPVGPHGDREKERDRDRERERPRSRQSAFHHIQTRNRNNVSPAASLLDMADNPAVSNILLVPASSSTSLNAGGPISVANAPTELNPVVSLISSMSEHIKSEDRDDKNEKNNNSRSRGRHDNDDDSRGKDRRRDRDSVERERYKDDRDKDSRDNRDRDRDRPRYRDRDSIKGNRSYESLRDRNLVKDSRNNSREQLYNSRDSLDDEPRGRRGDSRDRSYREDYYDKHRYV